MFAVGFHANPRLLKPQREEQAERFSSPLLFLHLICSTWLDSTQKLIQTANCAQRTAPGNCRPMECGVDPVTGRTSPVCIICITLFVKNLTTTNALCRAAERRQNSPFSPQKISAAAHQLRCHLIRPHVGQILEKFTENGRFTDVWPNVAVATVPSPIHPLPLSSHRSPSLSLSLSPLFIPAYTLSIPTPSAPPFQLSQEKGKTDRFPNPPWQCTCPRSAFRR